MKSRGLASSLSLCALLLGCHGRIEANTASSRDPFDPWLEEDNEGHAEDPDSSQEHDEDSDEVGGDGDDDAQDTPGDGDTHGPGDGDQGEPVRGACGVVPAPRARGASVPYFELEAEEASTNAQVLAKSRMFGELASEASGRSAVLLTEPGHQVEFTLEHPANSLVVRYAIPDAPGGGGSTATLGLYLNGVRRDLTLTSRYAWVYGDEDAQGPGADSPAAGTPHHFYDEVRVMFEELPAGSTIALTRDAQDTAAYYAVDLVDLEAVCPPLERPENSLSIVDHGATPDDESDDGPAIQAAIDAARREGKIVWIPVGRFKSTTRPLSVSGVTVRGAGMWYSELEGFWAQFKVSGNDNRFFDFAISGDVTYRDDLQGSNGFDGPAGTGSRLENVWIEHQKVGWWVGKGAYQGVPGTALTDGLVIKGVRIRNTFADGVNFANGTSNSVVEQSSLRNTGDDALATWSYSVDGPPGVNNSFRFNTVQAVWRATCLAIYGGKDHKIEDNECADTANYPGIFLATTGAFRPHPFDGLTEVRRNTLRRTGGPHYGYSHGAFKVFSDFNAIRNVAVSDLSIEDSTFFGLHFEGTQPMSDISFENVQVVGYGTAGIWVAGNAQGSVRMDDLSVSGGTNLGLQNDAPQAFRLERGAGNVGW